MNIIDEFKAVMASNGLITSSQIIADGELHRFHAEGDKQGSTNGWYCLYADNIPSGSFGCWKRGISKTWCSKSQDEMTPMERTQFTARIEAAKKQQAKIKAEVQSRAKENAQCIWNKAKQINTHPYLVTKGVKAYSLRMDDNGALVIPIHDTQGTLHSLQFISADGRKMFLKDGAIKGNYFLIGELTDTLYIAEGFATSATIHEVTNCGVIAAFYARNLLPVAQAIKIKYPAKTLIICSDNDQWTDGNPGISSASEASKAIGAKLVIPDFTNVDTSSKPTDFNDLHQIGGIAEVKRQLLNLIVSKSRLRAIELPKFLAMDLPPRELILTPWLPKAGLCMIHARPGVGKTHLSFGIAYAVATGGEILKWKAEKPHGVLLIDGEMPATAAQERFAAINMMYGDHSLGAKLQFVTPDLQEFGMPDLATLEGQREINELITDDIELVIVDNLSCLIRTGKENESESWLPVQTWALNLRAKGKSVLFIHHSGKGGAQRGSSKKEDVLDTVIALTRPDDYSPDQGACFVVNFEKSRGFHGEDAMPFEAMLTTNEHGQQCWSIKSIEQSTYEKVIAMFNDDMTQSEISDELSINKSTVSRHIRRAREEGRVNLKGTSNG